MKFLMLSFCIFITGCASTYRDVQTVTQTQYVVRQASAQQKDIPAYPPSIDVETATQVDLANWIVQLEERQLRLESIIRELIKFYEAPVVEVK